MSSCSERDRGGRPRVNTPGIKTSKLCQCVTTFLNGCGRSGVLHTFWTRRDMITVSLARHTSECWGSLPAFSPPHDSSPGNEDTPRASRQCWQLLWKKGRCWLSSKPLYTIGNLHSIAMDAGRWERESKKKKHPHLLQCTQLLCFYLVL